MSDNHSDKLSFGQQSDDSDGNPINPGRRRVLAGIAAATAAASGLAGMSSKSQAASIGTLPNPSTCGIDHIVVVMMENRSFDSMMGWVPGANGVQQGLSFVNSAGTSYATFPLAQTAGYGYQGCGRADPNHDYDAQHADYNNGLCNGFLLPQPVGDQFPIGYYMQNDVLFYSQCAQNWTICDAYHPGILSCTLPNRMYMHAGQTDRISDSLSISSLPTIWDSLISKGVSCKYYYADTPVTAIWGLEYFLFKPISHGIQQFVDDFGPSGTPPSVCYVDPYMGLAIDEAIGTAWDDHAFADIRDGQCFLNYIYNVVRNSPVWERTLLVINYDENGGFYDHVAPPWAPVSSAEAALGNDGRLCFRTPCVLIGPRARRGHIESTQFDPNSILNMIAWRFGLSPLGVRGATSNNLALALDFTDAPNTSAPEFNVSYGGSTGPFPLTAPFTAPQIATAHGVFGGVCPISLVEERVEADRRIDAHRSTLQSLQKMARGFGAKI